MSRHICVTLWCRSMLRNTQAETSLANYFVALRLFAATRRDDLYT